MLFERQLGQVRGADHTTPAIIVNAVFMGLAWFAVLLRVYTRVILVRVFYLEDWLMVFACVCYSFIQQIDPLTLIDIVHRLLLMRHCAVSDHRYWVKQLAESL